MKKYSEEALWRIFSKFVRARDATWQGYVRCISCSTVMPWKASDAGHFVAVGSDQSMKYVEDNVHAQCTACNRFKSGNLIEYRFRLVGKIGRERVEKLETLHQMKHSRSGRMSQIEINVLYAEYKAKFDALRIKKCLD